MIRVTPVVLCGGSGTRLWPLSRSGFPKQFLVFSDKESLFQQSLNRINALDDPQISATETIIITNEQHRFLVLDQLRDTAHIKANCILEPEAKNTAPALTLAALKALESDQDSVLVVVPADQAIKNSTAFQATIQQAVHLASKNEIVILGVPPNRIETGYGYIRYGAATEQDGAYSVLDFVEKPNHAKASEYIMQGDYAWNAGIFVLKASLWLSLLKRFDGEMLAHVESAWSEKTIDLFNQTPFIRPHAEHFSAINANSVDYAVLERCPASGIKISMLTLDAEWSDLGSWESVWRFEEKDAEGNAKVGEAWLENCTECLVQTSNRMVVALGVKQLVIIDTPDALLVSSRDESHQVKSILEKLRIRQRSELDSPRKVHRPWGWYDGIESGDRFKVKHIHVKPGASLSLQKHQHRSEHWVVVKGTATVTCDEDTFTLEANQSTYIPQGTLHRLANNSNEALEIIEVQSGSYLEEDDIERVDDQYGR